MFRFWCFSYLLSMSWYPCGLRRCLPSLTPSCDQRGLPWWPCGLRHCHWLLGVFHHCWVRIPVRACEKVASDLGKPVVFTGHSGFLHYLQLTSHDIATIWQKKWWKAKFIIPAIKASLIRDNVISDLGLGGIFSTQLSDFSHQHLVWLVTIKNSNDEKHDGKHKVPNLLSTFTYLLLSLGYLSELQSADLVKSRSFLSHSCLHATEVLSNNVIDMHSSHPVDRWWRPLSS